MFTPTDPNSQNNQQSNQPNSSDNLDDLFSSPPPSGPASGSPYTPPPPQPQQKRGNAILYIILGMVIAFMCICVGCIAITGGSFLAVANNPTVKAALATGQVAFGTGIASGMAPDTLPSGTTDKGAITANQQQSGVLSNLEQDVWKYTGKKGEQITVNVTAQDSHQLIVLGLYDSSSELLVGNRVINSGQPTQTISFALPTDGTYSILVLAFGGTGNASGNYSITVQSTGS